MRSLAAVLTLITFSVAGQAQNPCYKLVNATNHTVDVNFQYPGGVIPSDGIYNQSFSPGAWWTHCFPAYSATANIATPNTIWEGNHPMVMGNVQGALPPGTYKMIPTPPKHEDGPHRPHFEAINISTLGHQNYTSGKNVRWGGNTADTEAAYGDVLINDPPDTAHENEAVWTFSVQNPPGDLTWSICYAAAESRPVEVYLNGSLLSSSAAAATTGGWLFSNQKCLAQGHTNLNSGENTVRVYRSDVFPHIWRITFNQTHP